jgi:predicted HTH domain antitoxin
MSNQLIVQLPSNISAQEARFLLAAKLYEMGRISLGKAAELAEYSKPIFMELLGKAGIPVFNYPPEDLEKEMAL